MNIKEEILERVSDEMIDCFQFGNNLDLFDGQASTVFKAMDEYAKQECIAFMDFIAVRYRASYNNTWQEIRQDFEVPQNITTEQAYQIFKEQSK